MLNFDDLSAMSRTELLEKWSACFGTTPPRKMRANTLARILACEEKWMHSSESQAAIRQQLERVVGAGSRPTAKDGTRFIREWHGTEHVVDLIEGTYHWNGKPWKSLSAIAREITGAKWSGPRFFGVKA